MLQDIEFPRFDRPADGRFARIPWREAIDRYGSDKPDTRFALELQDASSVARGSGFSVFENLFKR